MRGGEVVTGEASTLGRVVVKDAKIWECWTDSLLELGEGAVEDVINGGERK